ncbi:MULTISPECIES: NAD-dependent succinate-semialdehyde dehydrogenase [unclassified Rhodococcus (in: high G+C Gram-positive bacteria)]|uniref:NAD-dependent succinate-semialdehyde dehydrogenase n=1 Tax=unclassified Rhodococcus (in: high G+C Gram-positive bacteria) TaxID=192944 RepID=UPI0005D4385B|nr:MULTISPECIES: NAD-dependent succinate-semialdehyde dehydrogenase [unclassified Rhodococcus (in: high G+C Gram-positive bacteria)]KJF19188.1 Succinate-semialdehyde dehydrogenase (NADP) [Rhodococcus sp. AD45]RZL20786.1 MAG: NAD-dependent succinate-semialdehyde dehydrogenase [Rhodococcus sp. (in: high G+C Gram-positive bacteria)]
MTIFTVTDPWSGTVVAEFPEDSDEQVLDAIAAAHAAYETWRTFNVADRALILRDVARLHQERRDQLAATMSREMGKAFDEALSEVDFSVDIYAYYADNAADFLADEPVPILRGEGNAIIRKHPMGVLLGIMPWNYPVYQVARFAGPNLAAGNTVLLKHALQCPQSAEALQAIFVDAGLPAGAYVNLFASNVQIESVIADPRVTGVSLTGSERAGSAVAEIAGRHLKKVVLELGGSDPFIVLGASDLEATVDAAVTARMENSGQACNAAKRMIVHENLYDRFLALFTERLIAITPAPLSSVAAAEKLELQVANAVSSGARLAASRGRSGAQFPSAVLTEVTRDNAVYSEELFGPVAMVFRARDEAEAVRLANDTPYGLGAYVFTDDPEQAQRVADRIDAGMVFINGVGMEGVELPFGGVKRSGFGRELGRLGIDEFVNKKLIRTVR